MAVESGLDQKKEKKPGFFAAVGRFFARIGRWFKSAFLELRKATWPKGAEVMKKLGSVLIVVLFFFLTLLLMDYLLGLGYTALTDNISSSASAIMSARSFGAVNSFSVVPIGGR